VKARLFVTAVLLGVFAGCAHQHGHGSPDTEIDEEAIAEELFDELCHDLERPPYYASSLRWGSVFEGMVAIGVLAEEADHQVRRAARSTVSARDVDKLLDKHEADAEAFLDALDEAHVAAGSAADKKKADEDAIPYGLPSEEALERWHVIANLIDRPPRCGNALHWLPVYKDLMRLGFSPAEAQGFCKRAVISGLSRFSAEELIDSSKRDPDIFAEGFEVAVVKAEASRSRGATRGLKAFFKGKDYKPKSAPQTLDVGPEEAPAEGGGETLEAPPAVDDTPAGMGDEAPADGFDEEPADGMDDEAPADGMDDEPPAEGMGDEPPAEGMGDEPPADEPPADVPAGE
jgi:hypothetical protein